MLVLADPDGSITYVVRAVGVDMFHVLTDYGDGKKGDYSYVDKERLLTFPTNQRANLEAFVNKCM